MKSTTLRLTTLTALMLGLPLSGQAQQLEEVVVSAQRRVTDLQSTPVAVTSLDSVQLERRAITEAMDIVRQVPNLVAFNNVTLGASNSYFMRGIGSTESLSTFDPPIITYVDEVVNVRQNNNNTLLVEVERVEVLRGPQGTLFGRNTTGGAINITTKKPDDQLRGTAQVRVGEFNELMIRGMINVPVTDRVFANFSAYSLEDDGWQTSVITGEDYNSVDGFGARAALRFEIDDGVTWDISADIFDQDHQNLASIVDPGLAATVHSADDGPVWVLGSPELNDVYLRNCKDGADALAWVRNGCTANEVFGINVYSNLEVDLDGPTLNIIAGYRELDHNFVSPLFASLRAGFDLPLSNNGDHDMFQLEAKLSGVAMDDRLNYVTGVFFLDEENFSVFETSLANPALGGVFLVLDRNYMENNTENLAWYGQVDYSLNDQWTLTGGLRFTNEEKTIPFYENTAKGFDLADIQAAGIITSDEVKKLSYRVVASYQATDDAMLFASATTGFKSGGWNGRAGTAISMSHFNEEEALSFELGARTEWFDNRLRINATFFNVTYDGLQLPALLFPPAIGQNPVFTTNNVGEEEVSGLEVDFSAGLTEGLSVYGSVGLQDAEYNSTSLAAQAGNIFPSTPVQRTPDMTWIFGVEYVRQIGAGGEFYVNADIQSTDDYFANGSADPDQFNPGWESVSASIGYISQNERWKVQLDCKNCLDERWWTTTFLNSRFIVDPMRWGLTATVNFGN